MSRKYQGFRHGADCDNQWLCSGWLRWRYDCKFHYQDSSHRLIQDFEGLGSIVVFFATTFALFSNVSNGFAAIVIVQSGVFAEASRQLVRVLAQVELDFNSVERIVEYLEVPQEAPLITERRPPAYWPSTEGQVHIDNLVVKYSESLPPALDHVSFTVQPREKIGVVSTLPYTFRTGLNANPQVGRTGSGLLS